MPTYRMDAVLDADYRGGSEVAAFSAELGLLSSQLDRIDGRTLNARADLDTGAALTAAAGLEAAYSRLEGRDINVRADLDAGPALAGIGAVEAARAAVDGKDIDIRVDVDTAGAVAQVATASAAMQALTISAMAVGRGVAAASRAIPGLGGALAGLGNLVVTTGAQLAALGPAGWTAAAGLVALTVASGGAILGALGALLALIGPLIASLTIAGAAAAALAGGIALVAAPFLLWAANTKSANDALKENEKQTEAVRGATEALRSAEERASDAARSVREARRSATEGVQAAIEQYRSSLLQVRDAERAVADAARAVRDARRSANEGVRAAIESYRSSLERVEDAEEGLMDARRSLQSATQNLISAQRDLNTALRDEPLNQAEAALDLADARDRLSDATRAYNEAVREYGRNSEEATDALRDLRRAELELERQERETNETRRRGSEELRGARSQYRQAYEERREAARGVRSAEEALLEAVRDSEQVQRGIRRSQVEGARQIRDAKRAERRAQEALAEAIRDSERVQRGIRRAQIEGARQIAAARRDEKRAQDAVASAVRDLARATRGQREEVGFLERAWRSLRGPVNRAFGGAVAEARLLARQLGPMARSLLPALGRASERSTRAMRLGFEDVRGVVGGSARNSLENILERIPRLMGSSTRATGFFAGGFLNFMEEAMPYAQRFLDFLERSARQFFRWSDSKEGRREIREFLESAVPVASALWGMITRVSGALFKLGTEHGDVAAAALDTLTYFIVGAIDAMDWLLDRFEQLARFFHRNRWLFNFLAAQYNRFVPGNPIPYMASGGDVPMRAAHGLPGVPLYRAGHGLDIPSHYVERPTLMSLSGLDVLYGEALSAGNREYAFRDGGNLRFITEEPGYDRNSFDLWRDLGERKGYILSQSAPQSGGAATATQMRRRDEKTQARIIVMLDGKSIRDYTTEVVWENLQSKGVEEFGL